MATLTAGFIGLGNLGTILCTSLVQKSGLSVTVYDLDPQAVQRLVALGAKAAKSPKEVAAASDVVVSLVRDQKQNNQVIFGKDGLWEGTKKGDITCISSTVGPFYVRDLYAKGKEKGIKVIDAAVTKITTDPQGRIANYVGWNTLMVGGDDEDVKRCWPILESMAKYVVHLGGPGAGSAMKLVNNEAATVFSALTRQCMIEWLNLGLKAGLSLEKMIEVWGDSTSVRMLDNLGLKPWFTRQEIIDIMKAGVPRTPTTPAQIPPQGLDIENLGVMYRRLALEMADKVNAVMPLTSLSDELRGSELTTYDAFSAAMT